MKPGMDGYESLKLKQLFAFFIPLGFSASLVTISHVIINSTLARSANPEFVISTYAIALSLLGIFERPGVVLRQTCSLLVKDRLSFRAMSEVSFYVVSCSVGLGFIVAYTPLGEWIFTHIAGVQTDHLAAVIHNFQIIIFVSIFSAIRCHYHGIIITNMRTKWLTIGMLIRLAAMYLLSLYYIQTDQVTSGMVGVIIFLTGMIIECIVSVTEGHSLVRKLPLKKEDHPVERKGQVFQFFRPLLFSSFIAVVIGPAINTMLGKTNDIELAIASFAIAASLMQLVTSFFSYMHQIILQFYRRNPGVVHRFLLQMGFIPCFLTGVLCYTSLGPWFMERVMGVNENLMMASLHSLRVFMLFTLIYPWLDSCNGILMLRGQNRFMIWTQGVNAGVTLLILILCISLTPGWNGMIGALAQSLGLVCEMGFVLYILKATAKSTPLSNMEVS
ncbi:MAG TPA: multi antimicrobial extrusion protein MatE [Bacilli bacterium]